MRAYYNEHDRFCCDWLQNLMDGGHITPGRIDDRDIRDVQPDDLDGYERVHLFAGIAGWDLALNLAGWHGPVWTGSCPCQPLSSAGQGKGDADERHLWPAFQRLIAERQPATVFGEQVASKLGREWMSAVRADMEGMGYAVGAADLCAAGVGAPHIRQRLWWVADAGGAGRQQERRCSPADEGTHGRRPEGDNELAGGSSNCGRLADAAGERAGLRRQAEPRRNGPHYGVFGPNGEESDRLGDAESGGWGQERSDAGGRGTGGDAEGREQRLGNDGSLGGLADAEGGAVWHPRQPWASAAPIECADGKVRFAEPGVFPLAHGVPARVGRLRAYGNAIVPQVAAAFVQAFMEAS